MGKYRQNDRVVAYFVQGLRLRFHNGVDGAELSGPLAVVQQLAQIYGLVVLFKITTEKIE